MHERGSTRRSMRADAMFSRVALAELGGGGLARGWRIATPRLLYVVCVTADLRATTLR